MTAEPDLDATVAVRLRRSDQRYTRARRELVALLSGAGRPLSIPDLLETRRGLPQSTVYRNLSVLEQAGVVRRVMGADEFTRYELAEDLTHHHHHLVCTNCRTIADITVSAGLERSMERALAEVAANSGFELHGHRLDLVGLCADCA